MKTELSEGLGLLLVSELGLLVRPDESEQLLPAAGQHLLDSFLFAGELLRELRVGRRLRMPELGDLREARIVFFKIRGLSQFGAKQVLALLFAGRELFLPLECFKFQFFDILEQHSIELALERDHRLIPNSNN